MAKPSSSFAFGSRPAAESSATRRFFSEISTGLLIGLTLLALCVFAWVGLLVGKQVLNNLQAQESARLQTLVNSPELVNKEAQLLNFKKSIDAVHQTFGRQSILSNALDFLEQNTHRQVRWNDFSVQSKSVTQEKAPDAQAKNLLDLLKDKGPLTFTEALTSSKQTQAQFDKNIQALMDQSLVRKLPDGRYVAMTLPSSVSLTGNAASYRALAEQLVAFSRRWDFVQSVVVRQASVSPDGGVSFTMQVDLNSKIFSRAAVGQASSL